MRTHTPFLGRSSELDLLDELVMEHRLISLVGPGGIGKTRLAREFALAKQASLDGNILFATLAGATAQDDVADLVARNAGLASVEALRYGSVDRARLIVLDNCEPALVGAAELARSLIETDRTTRVLVTTRVPLGLPEERVVMVGPLAMPVDDDPHHARSSPPVQLFVDRSQRAGALSELDDDTVLDIARLVRQLDGIPLAIELAAARTRVLSPRQISLLLDDDLGLLQRSGGGVDGHQSMRAVIAASYQPLAPQVQRGFRALCVFNAPFDLDLAHQLMCTGSELEAVEVITELIDSSMLVLTVGQGSANRYRVLEPIRRFGLERLEADGELEATVDRFVDVMAGYADAFVGQVLTEFSPELFGRVTERFAHLVHAIEQCIEHDATAARANRLFLPLFGTARNRGEQMALARKFTTTWHAPGAAPPGGRERDGERGHIRRRHAARDAVGPGGARRRHRHRTPATARPSQPRVSRGVSRGPGIGSCSLRGCAGARPEPQPGVRSRDRMFESGHEQHAGRDHRVVGGAGSSSIRRDQLGVTDHRPVGAHHRCRAVRSAGRDRGGAPARRRRARVVGRHWLRMVGRLCAQDHCDRVGCP